MNFHSPVYSYFKICNYVKKGTMWITRHILSLYTHISKCVATKRTMSFYSHIFYVYPYFKICSYKITMCLFIHIFSLYTQISKFVTIKKKELCE